MVAAALILLVLGGPSDAETATASPPSIEVLSPVEGEAIAIPLQLRFRTSASIGRKPGGWGTGDFHLHASIDGLEVMPGPADVQPGPDDSYLWTFACLRPGDTQIQLFWSDAAHRPIEGARTPPLGVRLRAGAPAGGPPAE